MLRAAPWLCAIAASFMACHPTRTLEPPSFEPDSASMILIVAHGEKLDVWATDLDEPKYPDNFDAAGEVELYAVEFCCPLRVLGLEPGKQSQEPLAKERPLLPPPTTIRASAMVDGVQSGWEVGAPAVVNDALLRLPLPEDHLCDLYTIDFDVQDATVRGTETSSTPSFGLRLADGTVLVATLGGDFYLVEEAEGIDIVPTHLTDLSTTTPHHGAFRRDDGEIFLLGKDGSFARGDLQRGFTIQGERSLGGAKEHVRLAGAKDGPVELYAVTDARTFQKFDGVRWTTISTAAPANEAGEFQTLARPAITYLGPEETLVARARENRNDRVQRYFQGALSDEVVFTIQEVAELYNFPTWGVIAGGRNGSINFRDAAERKWGESRRAGRGQVRAITPLDSRRLLIFALEGDTLLRNLFQFHTRLGSCPVKESLTTGFAREMIPLGERSTLMLVTNPFSSTPHTQMTVLRQKGEIAECLETALERGAPAL